MNFQHLAKNAVNSLHQKCWKLKVDIWLELYLNVWFVKELLQLLPGCQNMIFLRIKSLPQAISHLFLKWFRGKENDQPLSSAILSSMTRNFPFLWFFLHVFFFNIRLPSSIFSPPFHQQDTLNRNSSYTMAKTMANQVWKSTFGGRPQKGRGLSRTSACIHSLCEKKIIPTSNVEKIL